MIYAQLIKLFDYLTVCIIELLVIDSSTWNNLTLVNRIVRNIIVWSFNCVYQKIFTNHISNTRYYMCMYVYIYI